MKCNQYSKSFSAFLDNELPNDLTDQLIRHTETCEKCSKKLEMLKNTDVLLHNLPHIEPTAELEHGLWRKIVNFEEKKSQRSIRRLLLTGWRPYLATGLTALLIVGFFLFNRQSLPDLTKEEMMLVNNMELLTDYEIISQLDLLEDWEIISKLE